MHSIWFEENDIQLTFSTSNPIGNSWKNRNIAHRLGTRFINSSIASVYTKCFVRVCCSSLLVLLNSVFFIFISFNSFFSRSFSVFVQNSLCDYLFYFHLYGPHKHAHTKNRKKNSLVNLLAAWFQQIWQFARFLLCSLCLFHRIWRIILFR